MKKKNSTILRLLPMTKGFRFKYIYSFILIILSVILSYLTPQIICITVDSILGTEPFDLPDFFVDFIENLGGRDYLIQHITFCAFGIFALTALSSLASYISRKDMYHANEGTLERMRSGLFEHIQYLPYNFHNNHQTGDLISRCTVDIDILRTFLNDHFFNLFKNIFLILVAFILMFYMNVQLSLVALIFIPITLIYSFVFYNLLEKKFKAADECEGELSSVAQENFTAVRVVKAFGREKFELNKFKTKNQEMSDLWIKLGTVMGFNWGFADMISTTQIVTVIIVGIFLNINGTITTGQFISFVYYNNMLVWPVRQIGRVLTELSKTTVSANRLFYILDSEKESDVENPVEPEMNADIEFKNVNFSYDMTNRAVKNINFKIEGGKTLGILGSTGSGKSTLMYLLDRLYELPEENGTISIGGTDIRNIKLSHLRKNIGFVLQEPFLFSKSFKETISDASDSEDLNYIREHAKIAVIDDTILGFKDGYDTEIGERGVTISGGQKQRVAIARMLMQNTPIKIFDDSLSAIDMETDAKIRASINQNVKGTNIIIAHRIATIKNADLIIVMDKGEIVQQGTHESLSLENGIYKRIYDNQKSKD